MISWEQVKQKARANPGQFVDWDDNPYPYRGKKPRKRIEQCFIVQDVVWIITITDRYTGDIHDLECNNSDLERDFKRKHGNKYRWN